MLGIGGYWLFAAVHLLLLASILYLPTQGLHKYGHSELDSQQSLQYVSVVQKAAR